MAIQEIVFGGQEMSCFGYEAVTVSNTAIGFTAGTITPTTGRPCSRAIFTVETDQIRFTYDGSTTPTNTVGHLVEAGDRVVIEGIKNVSNFRAIRVTSDASIKCTYERFN